MNKLEKKVRALVEKDSFNDTCLNCAFYPGGGSWMCSGTVE